MPCPRRLTSGSPSLQFQNYYFSHFQNNTTQHHTTAYTTLLSRIDLHCIRQFIANALQPTPVVEGFTASQFCLSGAGTLYNPACVSAKSTSPLHSSSSRNRNLSFNCRTPSLPIQSFPNSAAYQTHFSLSAIRIQSVPYERIYPGSPKQLSRVFMQVA